MAAKNCSRALLSDGTPVSRPRAILIAARSRGSPTRLLRKAPVTNSSISLPVCRVMPRMIEPAMTSASALPNSTGLRKASIRPMSLDCMSKLNRSTVSLSMEWPKRYTTWANSATMAASISISGCTMKISVNGWILRTNSSNTRCWYCISLTKRAAWNKRSPFQISPSALSGTWSTCTSSHSLIKARSPLARMVCLLASTRRLCSEWNTWCTAVRPMFSLPRPSPVM